MCPILSFNNQHFINMEIELPRLPSMKSLAKIAEAIKDSQPESDNRLFPSAYNITGVMLEYQMGLCKHLIDQNCVYSFEKFMQDSFDTGAVHFYSAYPVMCFEANKLIIFVKDANAANEMLQHVKFLELLRNRIRLDGIAVVVEPIPHEILCF